MLLLISGIVQKKHGVVVVDNAQTASLAEGEDSTPAAKKKDVSREWHKDASIDETPVLVKCGITFINITPRSTLIWSGSTC